MFKVYVTKKSHQTKMSIVFSCLSNRVNEGAEVTTVDDNS